MAQSAAVIVVNNWQCFAALNHSSLIAALSREQRRHCGTRAAPQRQCSSNHAGNIEGEIAATVREW
jgi:hypothetical protein